MSTTRKFEVGDVCRIRQWDDMAEEFGVFDGEIECEFSFIEAMRCLCGAIFTIKDIKGRCFYSYEGGTFDKWDISADMLELVTPIIPKSSEDFDFDFDISELLGGEVVGLA